ncbi:MAG: divergent polysaccharide deacetylase family protein [Atribacterota bacterium]|nr:divergent polysaccharide deacetylase family protein [Atribacterota bacterium]
MEKKLWNYTFSILLSIILLLLLGIFLHLDGNGIKEHNSVDFENKQTINSREQIIEERNIESIPIKFPYEIFNQKEEELLIERFLQEKKEVKTDKPKIAIIIDDLGYQVEIAERLLSLDYPVAFSILPYLPYSQVVFKMAKENDITILMHLPMEPHDSNINPGKGAIYSNMTEEEIKNKLLANLNNLPGVDGVNNHMGSKVTENEKVMKVILQEIKNQNLFFVDSMTSPNSIGYALGKEMGVETAFRSVFLDNNQELDYIRKQFEILIDLALKYGSAIAIGHPYCNTVDILEEVTPLLYSKNIEVVKLTQLVK